MNQINVIMLMHRCAKNKLDLLTFIDIDSTLKLLDVKYGGVAMQMQYTAFRACLLQLLVHFVC